MPAQAQYGSLPFDEQIEFFKAKHPVLTRAWTDVYAAEHEHAFMVAGAAKADLLSDLRAAIDKVVADGGTLAQFRKDFDGIVERTGWQYKGGRNWRTRVIYETNLRQSYNAGREAQMADPDLRKRRPYGLYRHGRSEHPRPEHLAWDGTVLPLDDPWWETHSPQNGWGCKCRKLMVSGADVERMGLQVADKAPPVVWEEKIVGAKGPSPRVVRVPKGIDPGFEYRPGASVRAAQLSRAMLEKARALSDAAGRTAAEQLAESAAFSRWMASPEGEFALASLTEADAAAIGARTRTVTISAETARKQAARHKELSAGEYRFVQEAITRGTRVQDTDMSAVYLLEDDSGYVTVVKATRSGEAVFLTSFRRLSSEAAKRDREVRRVLGLARK
jgi:hypothetical protein